MLRLYVTLRLLRPIRHLTLRNGPNQVHRQFPTLANIRIRRIGRNVEEYNLSGPVGFQQMRQAGIVDEVA